MNPFYALITPVEQPSQPPSQPPGTPTHPIYYPPEISGPPGPWPSPPIAGIPGLPGYQPPSQPPGGGGQPPVPTHPIYYPPEMSGPPGPWPSPPIAGIPGLPGYNPPGGQPPGGGGGQPPGIWGPPGPWPSPPIAGIPGLPGYQPPGGQPPGGGEPGPQPLPAVLASDIPQQPEAPDPDKGAWVLVGLGAGQVGWAWLDTSNCDQAPDGEQPEAPATP